MHTVKDICLEDLGKCLHDACILVAVYLNLINQGNFDLGPFAEWLENGREFLSNVQWSADEGARYEYDAHPYFTQGKALYLVRPGTPIYRSHETLPDTLN